MKGALFMAERLKWNEIATKYPMQWVGLTDVKWEDDNDSTIESAVVSYSGLPRSEAVRLMHKTKGQIIARFTEPNKLPFIGITQ